MVCLGAGPLDSVVSVGSREFGQQIEPQAKIQYRGVDASFVPWYEDFGVVYSDENGDPTDPIALMATRGMNLLRIRVFVDPSNGRTGFVDMLELAQRGHDAGMDLLIDLHYSDNWADPGQQNKPSSWVSLNDADLALQVRVYTRDVIAALYMQGTPPAIVQVGNEITSGMLWPTGQIAVNGFDGLVPLLNAGILGVHEAVPGKVPLAHHPKIMIHIDRGGDLASCIWFYDNILSRGVEFDIIGLSFYPWWHGSVADLRQTITGVSQEYHKPTMLVEVAYPWTLGWNDKTHNFVGDSSQLVIGFDASPAGQSGYLDMISRELSRLDGDLGIGWCYWGSSFVADPVAPGSPWENLSLFDFSHRFNEENSLFHSVR